MAFIKRHRPIIKTGIALFCIMLMFAVPFLSVNANRGGGDAIQTSSTTGCSCHSLEPSSETLFVLDGLPEKYNLSTDYELTIRVGDATTGKPERSGFTLGASAGTLEAPATDVTIISSGEATHTKDSTDTGEWKVVWKSPEEDVGNVELNLTVMVTDGNGIDNDGDLWSAGSFVTHGEGGPAGGGGHGGGTEEFGLNLPAYWLGIIGLVMVLIIVGWAAVAVKMTHGKS